MSIPKAATARSAAAPSRLQLRSNLVGTALTLPAPLRKAANASLPASIRTAMPLGSGEIEVALGNLVALRAQSRNDQTGVRVALGSNTVSEPPPASGLIATGRAATLDAIDWIAFAKGGAPRWQAAASCRCAASTSPPIACCCWAHPSPMRACKWCRQAAVPR